MRIISGQSAWLRFLRWLPDARRNLWPRSRRAAAEGAGRRVIHLQRDELIHLKKNCGVKRIRVQHGWVWLTGTPAAGDILLRPGDEFELNDAWPFLLQPLLNLDVELELISKP